MEDAGQKLKKAREDLNLRFRDVEEASLQIARRRHNDEFRIPISRLADIENNGVLPTVHRVYSLCVIYRLNFTEVLGWFGVPLPELAADSLAVELSGTHLIRFGEDPDSYVDVPILLEPGVDLKRTKFLSRQIQRWGRLPLVLLDGYGVRTRKFALIGSDDWTMYPLLQPGAFIVIDETRRKIATGGWTTEFDRPIYFFEHRDGYGCSWLSEDGDNVIMQPHPCSALSAKVFRTNEIDIVGQVYAAATRLDRVRKRRPRLEAEPEELRSR
jgi:hypothetical protein